MHVTDSRRDCFELTREELDMVLLGQVHAFMNASETCGDDHKHKEAMRERSTMVYIHSGVQVCSYVFLFLHGVGEDNNIFNGQ